MIVLAAGLTAPSLAPTAALAASQSFDLSTPMGTIQVSNREILATLPEEEELDPETEARVYELMDRYTDFAAMSSAAIDRYCADIPADKCAEFKQVFTELLRVTSIKKLGRYRADRFDYLEQEVDGDEAVVYTVAYFEDDNVTLDYELENAEDGRWMIVNYIVDGADTVRNYRKQFDRLLDRESVDEVIARLRRKIAGYEEGTE